MGRRRGNTLTQDIGATGLNESFGTVREDFLKAWQTTDVKVKTIEEMLFNSPAVGALRAAIELAIRGIEWHFVSEEDEEDPRLELVNEAWKNLSHSWNDHIQEAVLMPFYGWSMFTIKYERAGAQLLWRKFKMLGHNTVYQWMRDEDGGLAGLKQKPHLNPEPIPIERMLLYRYRKTKDNPEGESILRPAYVPWYFAKNLQEVEAIGIERNLNGIPIVTPPFGADMTANGTDASKAEEIVRNVRNDEQAGVVLPPPKGPGEHERWRFELMSGGGQSKVIDSDMVISRYEKRILLTALSQFLMLGMDNIGALATFESGMSFFNVAVNAIADIIAETFSKYAIPRLLTLNGQDPGGITLEHTTAGDVDTAALGTALQQVAPLLTWTNEDEIELRGMLGLPQKTLEELEEVQAEREAAAAERLARLPQPSPQPPAQMAVFRNDPEEYYAADGAADDDERRGQERTWYDTALRFFRGQRSRVLKGARDTYA